MTSLRRLSRRQPPSDLPAQILSIGARGWSRTSNFSSIQGSWAKSRASFSARSCASTGLPWWRRRGVREEGGRRSSTACCLGHKGPLQQSWRPLGRHRLAFGWHGECSPALERLLSRAAEFGSQRLWQPMMAASRGKARGILMWKLRRKIGAAVVRANAMLLMDRVAPAGGDAAAAHSRQSRAESRFFLGRGAAEASCAHGQHRNAALDGRRRDRGSGFMSSLSRSVRSLSSPTFLGASMCFGSTFLSWLHWMLVGIWFRLSSLGIIFFFRSSCHGLARFKTSNRSGQRSLTSAAARPNVKSSEFRVGLDLIGHHFLSSIITSWFDEAQASVCSGQQGLLSLQSIQSSEFRLLSSMSRCSSVKSQASVCSGQRVHHGLVKSWASVCSGQQ